MGYFRAIRGDAIMAGFGVPMGHDDDEDRAVRCAISMLRDLQVWNDERQARGEQVALGRVELLLPTCSL